MTVRNRFHPNKNSSPPKRQEARQGVIRCKGEVGSEVADEVLRRRPAPRCSRLDAEYEEVFGADLLTSFYNGHF